MWQLRYRNERRYIESKYEVREKQYSTPGQMVYLLFGARILSLRIVDYATE